MRNSELIIEPPVPGFSRSREDLAKWQNKYTALPGRVVVLMDPPRDTYGGLVLPDSLNDKIRPECGTVIAGEFEDERVLLRPYAGLWLDVDGEQIRFINEPGDDIIGWIEDGFIFTTGNWLEVLREGNETTLAVSELGKRGWRHTASLASTCVSDENLFVRGTRVILTTDENAFLRIRWQDQDRCFIREVNRDGVRQVWAVIE